MVGCDSRTLPEKAYKLDEGVVCALMNARLQAIRSGDSSAVKGFFSPTVSIDILDIEGRMIKTDYQAIKQQAEINARYGQGFESEILERVIFVSSDQQKAVVQQRLREAWLFREKLNDIEIVSVSRMEWELIDDVPQITRLSKRIVDRTILNEVLRDETPNSGTVNYLYPGTS